MITVHHSQSTKNDDDYNDNVLVYYDYCLLIVLVCVGVGGLAW